MKTWICCLAVLASCNKHVTQADQDRQMYQELHDALVAPARRGPAFNTVPEPLPPAKPETTAGPAFLYPKDVGLVTFGVDGKVTLQKLSLKRVGAIAVTADGAVLVGAEHVFKVHDGVAEPLG